MNASPLAACLLSVYAILAISATSSAGTNDDARETRRLIHLDDGRVVRGTSKLEGDTWLVNPGNRWIRVPEYRVVRVAIERRVLSEVNERARALPRMDRPDGLDARVELAEWMTDEGLYQEAMHRLDGVLDASPDDERALDLVHRIPARLAMPSLDVPEEECAAAITDLLAFTATAPRTAWERAISAMARSEFRDETLDAVLRDLVDPAPRRRTFAALALRRLAPGAEPLRLVSRSILDVDEDVRREASLALRGVDDPGIVIPAVNALSSDNAIVRMNAAEALGTMGYTAAVEPLMASLLSFSRAPVVSSGGGRAPRAHVKVTTDLAYVSDFDVEIAQAASIADPIISVIQSGVILDAASLGVSGYTIVTHKRVIRSALTQLTGANPGDRTEHWRKWWEENADRFREGATIERE